MKKRKIPLKRFLIGTSIVVSLLLLGAFGLRALNVHPIVIAFTNGMIAVAGSNIVLAWMYIE